MMVDKSELDAAKIERAFRDEWQCAHLINRYANLNDAADWESLAALFVEDGILARPTAPEADIVGRGAILASFRARPPRITRHFVTNIEVTLLSAESARAVSSILLYTGDLSGQSALPMLSPAGPVLGGFDDMLRRIEGQWYFAERRGHLYFR